MQTRPSLPRFTAARALVMLGALVGAPACDDTITPDVDPALRDATVGEVEVLVADMPDGTSERQYFLNATHPTTARLRLRFGSEFGLGTGDRVGVWGDRIGDEINVSSHVLMPNSPDIDSVTSALIGAPAKPRTAVFVIVDVGGGSNVTNAMATSTVFSPGNNFATVYDKLSFGIMKLSGDVQGPFSYPMTSCDYTGLQRAVKPMINGTYQHFMWYFGSKVSACAWSGIGSEGNAAKPQADSWYNASTGCTVLVQEVGHNMGWMHSSTLACTGATFVDDPTTCKSSEYGNRMTPMGSGCGQLNGHDAWYGGFLGGCNGVKVTSSATFNLFPLENACNAIQTIQIPMVKTGRQAKPEQGNAQPLKNYYLEYRGPWGLDTSIKTPAVYVYAGDDIKVATRTSNWSWLLDMNPATTTFDGLTAGGSFTDPTGEIKVTVMSADTTKAVVQIDVQGGAGAAPTCIDNSTVEAPGPIDCGSGPVTGAAGAGGGSGAAGAGGTTGTGAGGTTGAAGRGGATGTAGRGGAGGAGAGAAAGRGGTTGAAGATGAGAMMGAAGRGGSAGTNGAAGTTGAGGTIVITGAAGAVGTGVAGTTGAGTGVAGSGSPITGVAGSSFTGTAGRGSGQTGGVTGGCDCAIDATNAGRSWGTTSFILIGALFAARRRRRWQRPERPD